MTHALDDDPAITTMSPGFVPPRRSRWSGRLVVAWLASSLALALGCICFLVAGLAQMGWPSFHIVLDGNNVLDGLSVSGFQETAGDLLAIAALLAALLLLVLLPLILMGALMAGLGLPVLVVALVLAIVLSPFWLAGWFIWRWLGGGRPPRRARSTGIPA